MSGFAKTPSHPTASAQPAGAAAEWVRQALNLGGELIQQGRAAEAIPILEKAHALVGRCVAVLINLAGAYIMAGRHREAVPLLEQARDAEPNDPAIWINLAAAYLGNPVLATPDQQAQAIGAFQEALRLDPNAASAHYNLGLIYVDRREWDLARAAFQNAMLVDPEDRDAQIWLRRLDARGLA